MAKVFKQFWWIYPLLAMKVFIYYWQTSRLDMMNVYEVPILTFLILLGVVEVFSMGKGRPSRYAFVAIYSLFTAVMFADAAYSSYFGKYISVAQVLQLSSLGQVAAEGNTVGAAVGPGCLLTWLDFPFVLYLTKLRRRRGGTILGMRVKKRVVWLVFHIALYGVCLCGWIYFGFNPSNLRSVQKVNHIEFFTYHTNDLLVNVWGKLRRSEADEEEILAKMDEIVPKSSGDAYAGAAQGMNLILIQTESLNDFVIGAEYNGQELTPTLNALLEEDTLYFNHFYSTTGVGNTCDAEFSALNSLYPNDERECYRMYVDNTYDGLPWMLRDEGYEALAFHGYVKTFWNREEAYKNIGFQHFYSEEELDVTEVSGFGLTDKEMFRQAVDILKEEDQPFFSFMITLTNHIPYELDPSLASLTLKEEDEGTTFGNYMQTVRYTDEAFGDLIRYLKENDLYDNTMIVIYGDHQGMNMETASVKSKMTDFLGKTYNYDEMLSVPFLIHIPGLGEAKTFTTVGGEVDIMPTIANLMNLTIDQPYVFGHDLLNSDEGFLAQISYIGEGSFIAEDNNMLFAIGKDGTVENGSLWNLATGEAMNVNVSLCQTYSDRAQSLLDTCKEVLDYNLIADHVVH